MSTSPLTAAEAFENLTGFDQLAITKAFGASVTTLGEADRTMVARALVFVDRRSAMVDEGATTPALTDQRAFEESMTMPLGQVSTYFADDDEDEPLPGDLPETESGKDGPHDEPTPTPWPAGASLPIDPEPTTSS